MGVMWDALHLSYSVVIPDPEPVVVEGTHSGRRRPTIRTDAYRLTMVQNKDGYRLTASRSGPVLKQDLTPRADRRRDAVIVPFETVPDSVKAQYRAVMLGERIPEHIAEMEALTELIGALPAE